MDAFLKDALRIVTDPAQTHEQALMNLSNVAGSYARTLAFPADFWTLKEQGVLCDMGEGYLPYTPRYLLPDYEKLMKDGCAYLRLPPPKTLFEAVTTLEMFYRHVPSITNFPVYLGSLDTLLEPFIGDEEEARYLIRSFLTFIDRTISDSYCHVNLGPKATRAGEMILDAQIEMQNAIPGMTLLYDPEVTPDPFAEKAVQCALLCAKPSFANHKLYASEHKGGRYGIASCYNALEIGGGAFTLSRIVLKYAAEQAASKKDLLERVLPCAVETLCGFMDEKIRFLVEESHFFKSNFLVQEGFLQLDQFVGMFGVVGLCECVNLMMEKEGRSGLYGHSPEADDLGLEIMETLERLVGAHTAKYCACTGHRYVLHAQVGIDSDGGISPGVRIGIGDEPPLYAHLRQAGKFHRFFPSGVGDIFPFDSTVGRNPGSILDVVKGAFACGMRYFSTYAEDADVIRVTGYLVKRSDMEKLDSGKAVRQHNAVWGLGAVKNGRVLERKVRSL